MKKTFIVQLEAYADEAFNSKTQEFLEEALLNLDCYVSVMEL